MRSSRGFSLIELLIVIAIVGVLVALLSGQLLNARQEALNASCVDRLGKIGKALNRYNKEFYSGKNSELLKLTPEQEMMPEATLIPLIELVRAGLIKTSEEVTCPAGHGDPVAEFSADPDAPKNLLYYAMKEDLKFEDIVLRNRDGEVMSSYLFTYKYQKINHKDRVIAADAAVADGKISLGYSKNHGDHIKNGKFIYRGGANALFADGHVKSCGEDYKVNSATDTNDLWLSNTAGIDPNFKRLDADVINENSRNTPLTTIGGIPPLSNQ